MAIRSGIGIGEAQVYDTSNLENTYYKLLQRQAQEDAKFQNEMADLISKVKTEGARDIDKPLITKGYEELKDIYRQASSVRNSRERNLLRSQLTSSIQSLNEAAARSAEEAKLYANTLNSIASTGEYMYDKSKLDAFKNRFNTPITQLSAFNPLDLQKLPDDSIRDKAFDNIYSEVKNKGKYQTRNLGGGKEQEVLVVDPNILKATIAERVSKNPGWKNLAVTTYLEQNPGQPIDLIKAIDNETNLYLQRKGNEYISAPTRIPKASGGGDDVSSPSNYQVTRGKTFVTSPTYDRTGKITSNGKPIITFDTFVTTPVGQPFATPQIGNAFNITEGKPESIGSKKGLRITGMGVKNGNLRVTVVDDDEVEYYLKPQDIPLNIRNGKQYKAAERALGGSSSPAPAPKPTGKTYTVNGKSYTKAQIENAAKQSGVSFDEYIKQVKAK